MKILFQSFEVGFLWVDGALVAPFLSRKGSFRMLKLPFTYAKRLQLECKRGRFDGQKGSF